MDHRLNFVTLAVEDLEATRAFYCDSLGWPVQLHVPGEVLMIRVGAGLVLSFWDADEFEDEVGYVPQLGRAPITLAHNVAGPEEVDAVLEAAADAGADVAAGERRDWGGYSGYFTDPNGYRWEVAHNPGEIGEDVLAESLAWWNARPGNSAE